jgi:hypothetical protein
MQVFSATASSTTSAVPATPPNGAIFLRQNNQLCLFELCQGTSPLAYV